MMEIVNVTSKKKGWVELVRLAIRFHPVWNKVEIAIAISAVDDTFWAYNFLIDYVASLPSGQSCQFVL